MHVVVQYMQIIQTCCASCAATAWEYYSKNLTVTIDFISHCKSMKITGVHASGIPNSNYILSLQLENITQSYKGTNARETSIVHKLIFQTA